MLKKFLKKLLLMLLAILISAPLALIIMTIVEFLTGELERYDIWRELFLVAIFSIPFYIVLGIPVTIIIDALNSKTKEPFGLESYLLQLFLYSLSAIAVNLLLFPNYDRDPVTLLFSIPVYTYFHVLFYLRKRKAAKSLRI
jgi:uncharacterized membrane protein